MHTDFIIEPKTIEVTEPILVNDEPHPFSAAAFSRIPIDLALFDF